MHCHDNYKYAITRHKLDITYIYIDYSVNYEHNMAIPSSFYNITGHVESDRAVLIHSSEGKAG